MIEFSVPEILLANTISLKSEIQLRVQEEGKKSDGTQIGNYSTRKANPLIFLGKGTATTDNKLKALAKKGKKISSSEFRKLDGKQNRYVDLTFTGRMFKDIGISSNTNGNESTVVIAPKTQYSKTLVRKNTNKYGNFLQPTLEEIANVNTDVNKQIEAIIKRQINDI